MNNLVSEKIVTLKVSSVCVLFITLCASFTASSQNVMDSVALQLLEHKFPMDVYNRKDITWEHGTYSVSVIKNGKPTIKSTSKLVNALMPIKVNLQARITKDLGVTKVSINCLAEFDTDGDLTIIPDEKSKYMKADAVVNIEVPDVNMNCEGFKIPISVQIRSLVSQNKYRWEKVIKNKYLNMWKS